MDEAIAIGDADICRWLSSVFARELSADMIAAYRSGAAEPFLDALSQRCDIEPGRSALEAAILGWSDLDRPVLALAAEYGALFLVPGNASAMPFASYYEEGTLYGAAHGRMTVRLEASNQSISAIEQGPADHVAVMLEYLATLMTAKAEEAASDRFVADELVPLATSMNERISRGRCRSDFYAAMSTIMLSYLKDHFAR